jgi:hypothetical protein
MVEPWASGATLLLHRALVLCQSGRKATTLCTSVALDARLGVGCNGLRASATLIICLNARGPLGAKQHALCAIDLALWNN